LIALLVSTVLAAAPAGAPSEPPGWVLEKKEVIRIRADLTFDAGFPKLVAKEWVLYVPVAPNLPGQTNAATVLTTPKGDPAVEKSPLERDVLKIVIPVEKAEQKTKVAVKMTFAATLHARHLRKARPGEKPAPVADLAEKEKKDSLLPFGDLDFRKKPVQDWLKAHALSRRDGEGEIDFARRVFQTIRSKLKYDYRPEMDRSAAAVCADGNSDCGGLSVLFAAALRANGIPARTLYGRWAISAKPDDVTNGVPYHQTHVQAEFFARGVGWVPVDPACAIVHDRSKDGLKFFGHSPGDFLTLHVDPNLRLDTVHFGVQDVHCLQSAAFWVNGSGSFGGERIRQDWKVDRAK
jgi:hypothetical protein